MADINDRKAIEKLLEEVEEQERVFRILRRKASFQLPDGKEITIGSEEKTYQSADGARITEVGQPVVVFADCGHPLKSKADVGRTCSCGFLLCQACAKFYVCALCGDQICINCSSKGIGTDNRYCDSCLHLHRLKSVIIVLFYPLIFLISSIRDKETREENSDEHKIENK